MTAEQLRKVQGGVVGCLTPKETIVDIAKDTTLGAVGDHSIGLTVPAGALVYGAYVKNLDNDLASGGAATVAVKVGTVTIQTATALATLKGKGIGTLGEGSSFEAGERDVKLTVATAALTAGKLTVGVIYG